MHIHILRENVGCGVGCQFRRDREGRKEQRLPHDHRPMACLSLAGLWPSGQKSRVSKLQVVPRDGCEELGTVSIQNSPRPAGLFSSCEVMRLRCL